MPQNLAVLTLPTWSSSSATPKFIAALPSGGHHHTDLDRDHTRRPTPLAKSGQGSTNTQENNMPTTGRPLGLATIKQHLAAIASDLPAGTDRDMCEAISTHLGQKNFMRQEVLHDVVIDLDRFVGANREFLGEATVAYTNRCIDSLARMEHKLRVAGTTKAVMTKVSAKNIKRGPSDHVAATKATQAAMVKSQLHALADAIHVLVNEVADGHDDIDTFDSIRGLVNVMERLA